MTTKRQCGGCTLCCTLLPVKDIDKPANTRCTHQLDGGCFLHGTALMPRSCRLWRCLWLDGSEVGDRPDRSHYVVDVVPDYIEADNNGQAVKILVIQVWIDPAHPDAHQDPALRAFLAEAGESGIAALIRYSASDGFVLFPPAMTGGRRFYEYRDGQCINREHTVEELAGAIRV